VSGIGVTGKQIGLQRHGLYEFLKPVFQKASFILRYLGSFAETMSIPPFPNIPLSSKKFRSPACISVASHDVPLYPLVQRRSRIEAVQVLSSKFSPNQFCIGTASEDVVRSLAPIAVDHANRVRGQVASHSHSVGHEHVMES